MSGVLLLPCDVVTARSHHFLGSAISIFTRRIGESRTIATHCGIITEPGIELNATLVESNWKTEKHSLRSEYEGSTTELCVFRPLNLTQQEKDLIVAKALTFVGDDYGWWKLGLHLADWCLDGAYVFRRLGRIEKYPICSFTVAKSFEAAKKDFGVSSYAASPDDIWDFCIKELNKKYQYMWQSGTMFKPWDIQFIRNKTNYNPSN